MPEDITTAPVQAFSLSVLEIDSVYNDKLSILTQDYINFNSVSKELISYNRADAPTDLVIPNTLQGFTPLTVAESFAEIEIEDPMNPPASPLPAHALEFMQKSLTSVTIPNTVTKIGAKAFANNNLLTDVALSSATTKIEHDAFAQTSLTNITLPEGLVQIDSQAFYKTKLREINIPSSVINIGTRAFSYDITNAPLEPTDTITLTFNTMPSLSNMLAAFAFETGTTVLNLPPEVSTLDIDPITGLAIGSIFSVVPGIMHLNLNAVTSIVNTGFAGVWIVKIIIGSNVTIDTGTDPNALGSFTTDFVNTYNSYSQAAGTYEYDGIGMAWVKTA